MSYVPYPAAPPPHAPYAPHGGGPFGAQPPHAYREGMASGAAPQGPLPGKGYRMGVLAAGIVALTFVILGVTTFVLGTALNINEREPPIVWFVVGWVLFMIGTMAINAKSIVALVWVHKMWTWLPEQERVSRMWSSRISPAQATFFLLIPYFQYYWMFVVNCALADAMDRMQISVAGPPKPSAKGTAIAACVCTLVFFPASIFLWHAYMKRVEETAALVHQSRVPAMA
ncbi:MAG: hypothetical protein HOO96_09055 [Polyangiaceae bacterium]|nr:hypothetical protein [Polyangiaceae bacterium]